MFSTNGCVFSPQVEGEIVEKHNNEEGWYCSWLLSSPIPNHSLCSSHTGLLGMFLAAPGIFPPLLPCLIFWASVENSFTMALSIKPYMCPATVHLMTLLWLVRIIGHYLSMFICLVAAWFTVPGCKSFKGHPSSFLFTIPLNPDVCKSSSHVFATLPWTYCATEVSNNEILIMPWMAVMKHWFISNKE